MRKTHFMRTMNAVAGLLLLSAVVLGLTAPAAAAALQKVQRSFDALGRLETESYPDGRTIRYEYDAAGNRTLQKETLRDDAGVITYRTTRYEYDGLNRLQKSTVEKPSASQQDQVVTYSYDDRDNLLSVKDPRNLSTTYQYNGFDELKQQTSPDTGVSTFDWKTDPGVEKSRTDARNKTLTSTWDDLGRPLTRVEGDETVSWTWDTAVNGKGKLHKLVRTRTVQQTVVLTLSQTFSYDTLGRLSGMTQNVRSTSPAANVTHTLSYGYDSKGRLSSLTYPNGGKVTYVYDTTRPDQIASVTWTSSGGATTSLLDNIQWQPFGGVKGWTWGNGLAHSRSYDNNGRLDVLSHTHATQGVLYGKDLTWDLGDRIRTITDLKSSSATQQYDYDWLDRLTAASEGSKAYGYSWDINGNRLSATWNTATFNTTYSPSSNRVSGISGARSATYSHDAAGNVRSDGNYNYYYNDSGRLRSVRDASDTTTLRWYYYNGLGERIVKSDGATNHTLFVYDAFGHLVGEYAYSGTSLASYQEHIWLGDTPIANMRNGVTSPLYVLADHLNTPRRVVFPSNNMVVWQWNGEPFGADQATGSGTYNLRFPGQYYDAETGKHYNYFRDYDPAMGRYIESDPIGLAGGLNTYGYVGGAPPVYYDNKGLAFAGVFVGAGVRAVGGRAAVTFVTATARKHGWPGIVAACLLAGVCNMQEPDNANPSDGSGDEADVCPPRPEFDWNDPSVPPVGPDGNPWPWRGPDAPGGARGGYVNPSNPDQSAHPDLNHPPPVGPHWDFTDRAAGGWRVFPDGTVKPK